MIPSDTSFLNSLLYEGFLRYSQNNKLFSATFQKIKNTLTTNIDEKNIQYSIRLTGKNDEKVLPDLFKSLGIISDEEYNKMTKLKENKITQLNIKIFEDFLLNNRLDEHKIDSLDSIVFSITRERGRFYFNVSTGVDEELITGLQIFKCERYTGITSLDTSLTSKQISLRFSNKTLLLAILGLFSSYVGYARGSDMMYFLFFTPATARTILENGSSIDVYLNIKDRAAIELRNLLSKDVWMNELIYLDLTLNLAILQMLEKENIERLEFLLFKIKIEGNKYKTYKIYDNTLFTIYKESTLKEKIKKIIENKDFINRIYEHFIDPNKSLLKRLSLKNPEYNNLLNSYYYLYRFITAGDFNNLYMCIRELMNCSEKVEGKERKLYINVIKDFNFIL